MPPKIHQGREQMIIEGNPTIPEQFENQNKIPVQLSSNCHYYMAVSHKEWELPNSRIWLAEIDIDCGLDFPI